MLVELMLTACKQLILIVLLKIRPLLIHNHDGNHQTNDTQKFLTVVHLQMGFFLSPWY